MEQSSSDWKYAGRITYADGILTLPEIPPVPGLYRLRFDSGAVYFGEANILQRRLGDYVVYYRSSGVENEFRLNKRLNEERGAEVDIMLDDSFITKSSRCVREHIEIKKAKHGGFDVINGGTIPDRIAFHRAEIERLEAALARSGGNKKVWDLDELMHEELLSNESANAMADELAIRTAKELGFGQEIIDLMGPRLRESAKLQQDKENSNG